LLFQIPTVSKQIEVVWTDGMKAARQYLSDGEIIPFAKFPHLLAERILAEIEYPERENVLPDVYNALREFNCKKFLNAYSRLPKNRYDNNVISDNDIRYGLLDCLMNQKNITIREMKLMQLLEKYKTLTALALVEFE